MAETLGRGLRKDPMETGSRESPVEQLDVRRTVCDFSLFTVGRAGVGWVAEVEGDGVGTSPSWLPHAIPWQVSCVPYKGNHELVLWNGHQTSEDMPSSASAITCRASWTGHSILLGFFHMQSRKGRLFLVFQRNTRFC